jgi:tetratricopeptide (TPR) repeat protein
LKLQYLVFAILAFVLVLTGIGCTSETETLSDEGYQFDPRSDYEKAINAYSEAIELDPENAEGYRLRGVSYYFLSNLTRMDNPPSDSYDKALDDFYKVVELKGDPHKPLYEQPEVVQIAEGFLVLTYEEIACDLDNKYWTVGNQQKWDTFVKERSGGYGSVVGLPALPIVALAPL